MLSPPAPAQSLMMLNGLTIGLIGQAGQQKYSKRKVPNSNWYINRRKSLVCCNLAGQACLVRNNPMLKLNKVCLQPPKHCDVSDLVVVGCLVVESWQTDRQRFALAVSLAAPQLLSFIVILEKSARATSFAPQLCGDSRFAAQLCVLVLVWAAWPPTKLQPAASRTDKRTTQTGAQLTAQLQSKAPSAGACTQTNTRTHTRSLLKRHAAASAASSAAAAAAFNRQATGSLFQLAPDNGHLSITLLLA